MPSLIWISPDQATSWTKKLSSFTTSTPPLWKNGHGRMFCSTRSLALDQVATATVVLSQDRRILLANPAAETLFKQSPVPLVRAGRLCAVESVVTTAMGRSLSASLSYQFDSSLSLLIRLCGSPGNGIVLRSGTATHCHPQGQPSCRHWLYHSGGGPAHELQTVMTTLYKLTPAEAALVKALSEGLTPEAFGDQRDVGLATVKRHLQSVFSKTGTRRQSACARWPAPGA